MGDVVLHIGLHKTATRFLQRSVFRSLNDEYFVFNPAVLMPVLRNALRDRNPASRRALVDAARAAREQAGDRTLVVSEPTISGDMYGSHFDYAENLALVSEVFPDARVVYFVRRQSDWLHSAYRQSLVKGRGIPIETFLNFYDGEFRQRIARRVFGVRNVEAYGLRFLDLYRAYADCYGAERVYLFRQEDLRHRPRAVYGRLAEALGLATLPPLPERVSGNRAFSALAIDLFFPRVHCSNRRPRPEDAGVRRSRVLHRIGKPWRKFRTAFIRHVFDRVIYRDRDLLARHGMRAKLDAFYESEHRCLNAVTASILEDGPGPTALAAADRSTNSDAGSEYYHPSSSGSAAPVTT